MAKEEQQVAYLFNEKTRYQVPLYQRRYVWHEANWEALWRDIIQLQDDRNHFTGTVIKKSGDEIDSYTIVDGQQRLITFQIIFCVLRDLWNSKGYITHAPDDLSEEIKHKLFTLTKLGSLGTGSLQRSTSLNAENGVNSDVKSKTYPYRIFITKKRERDAFELVVSGDLWKDEVQCKDLSLQKAFNLLFQKGFDDHQAQSQQHRIITAYGYFGREITKYLANTTDKHRHLAGLLDTLLYRFFTVSAILEPEDRPQQAYRSINDTGVALDEFDLLRNDLFLRAENREKQDEFYSKYWSVFGEDGVENHFWEKPGRTDQFLKDFLMAKLGPEADFSKRLFHHVYKGAYCEKLKKELNIDENDFGFVQREFQELSKYAKIYEAMEDATTDIGRRSQFYRDLKITSLNTFILYLKNELDISEEELEQVCDILESYIIRRMVNYGFGANEKDKEAYETINKYFSLLIEGEKFSLGKFARFLLSAESEQPPSWPNNTQTSWPTNTQILGGRPRERGGVTAGGLQRTADEIHFGKHSSRSAAVSLLRYIFYRIEKHTTMDKKLSFDNFLDIPTRLTNRPPEGREWRSIGNLTFRAKDKRDEEDVNYFSFQETTNILSARPNAILKLNRDICESENWKVNEIKTQTQKLGSYFCEIWSRGRLPSGASGNRSTKPKAEQKISSSIKQTQSDPMNTDEAKNQLRWISLIESQTIWFTTNDGRKKLSNVEVRKSNVIGLNIDKKESTFNIKQDILFAYSEEAYPKLLYRIPRRILQQKLKTEQLSVDDITLKSTQENRSIVTAIVRSGHELRGIIEGADKDAIYMRIDDQTVIVFRHSLIEFCPHEKV